MSRSLLWGTWTPKVCEIMAFMAVIVGLGLLPTPYTQNPKTMQNDGLYGRHCGFRAAILHAFGV